jgi:hypothetical protein
MAEYRIVVNLQVALDYREDATRGIARRGDGGAFFLVYVSSTAVRAGSSIA